METEAVSRKYSTSGYSRLPVLVSAVMLFANEVIMNVLTQAGLQEGGVLAVVVN